MYTIGDTVIRNNKPCTIIGVTQEGRYIVQYDEDTAKGLNRCYLYWDHEVSIEITKKFYLVSGEHPVADELDHLPTVQEIKEFLIETGSDTVRIEKEYVRGK